ncbi:MAG: methyltransferase domain-containing protein [Chloroflexi bacterium]|uniref:methyltransferase domain-containing protein n=1 Tax=Candidatus Flexifilum breve TaxID=3140694 RepID=UPI0031355E2B|nr:methyltransferase domain-containing protein [Chloroflexota bacterium]
MADNAALVNALKDAGLLTEPRLERAFRAVPRHLFLPQVPPEQVYSDQAIAIKQGADGTVISSSSQPSMMAHMLNQLRLTEGCNVLEIGTGSGYNAALMQHIVGDLGKVTTIELDKELAMHAENHLADAGMRAVNVVHGDGALGYAPRAAYDRIIASVGVWDVLKMWVRQLKPDGLLVAPIWWNAFQLSAAFTPSGDGTLTSRKNTLCNFVVLRGGIGTPSLSVRLGTTPLWLDSSEAARIDTARLHALLSYDAEREHLSVPLTFSEMWSSFIPYLVLNTPPDFVFAKYQVRDSEQHPYGIEGMGFALLARGSACFIPLNGNGVIYYYGSADSFMATEDALKGWNAAKRPKLDQLRLRLIPKERGEPEIRAGKLYPRRDHTLHVWFEDETT